MAHRITYKHDSNGSIRFRSECYKDLTNIVQQQIPYSSV